MNRSVINACFAEITRKASSYPIVTAIRNVNLALIFKQFRFAVLLMGSNKQHSHCHSSTKGEAQLIQTDTPYKCRRQLRKKISTHEILKYADMKSQSICALNYNVLVVTLYYSVLPINLDWCLKWRYAIIQLFQDTFVVNFSGQSISADL